MSRRVFNTYHASEAEIEGVKQALEDAGVGHYETFKGAFGLGSAAIWIRNDEEFDSARKAIDRFQAQWRQQVRSETAAGGINWPALPALVIVIIAVLFLTLFWYL